MNNKKAKIIIAILIFIFLGLIIFAFASPNDENGENLDNRVKQGEVDKKPSKDTEKESKDEKNGKENENTTPTEKKESKKEETPAKEEPKEEPAEEPAEEVDLAYVQAETLVKKLETMIANAENRSNIESAAYFDENAEIAELIAEIKDAEKKAELEERYAACTKVLNAEAPEVNIDTLLNEDTAIEVTSEIKITLTLSKDGKEAAEVENGFVVKEDGNYVLVVTDEAFNETKVEFTMDQTPIALEDLNIESSNENPTQEAVTVTITANEVFSTDDKTWALSEDEMTLTKTFNDNAKETVVVKDAAGNETEVEITVANIDRTPIAKEDVTVSYSTTTVTNQPVTVTVTAEEAITTADENWTQKDEKTLTQEFAANVTDGKVVILDAAGNDTEVSYAITNIDTVAPKITDQKQTWTGWLVVSFYDVELTFSEPVKVTYMKDLRRVTTPDYVNTITLNGVSIEERNITIVDEAGNSVDLTIALDTTAPVAEPVEYSTTEVTDQSVTVTVKANEKIKVVDGWALSEDEMSLSKTFAENTDGDQELVIADIAGNTTTVTYNVANIDLENPVVTGVDNNGVYNTAVKPVATDLSTVTMTLAKDKEAAEEYTGEVEISDNGVYTLVATDAFNHSTTVVFTIKGAQVSNANYEVTNTEYTHTFTRTKTTYKVTTTITFDEKVKLNLAEGSKIDTTKIVASDADENGFAKVFTVEGLKVTEIGNVFGTEYLNSETFRDLTFVNEAGYEATITNISVIENK